MEMIDNWKFRGANMRCISCMYFMEKEIDEGPMPIKESTEESRKTYPNGEILRTKKIGRCRRHAPKIVGFPVVFDSDWCGDHKLDETRL